MQILLISTYEMGHQPMGLASPAAWLREAGFEVSCIDLASSPLPPGILQAADLIGVNIPMHTATRLAIALLPDIKIANPDAHICFYGLYAPMNAALLHEKGVDTLLGGEYESGLLALAESLRDNSETELLPAVSISLDRQQFRVPDRGDLPHLSDYVQLIKGDDSPLLTGYVETTRGCKHLCRHCPIVPVYNGRFRVIQREVVLADIRQQVEAGAQHIVFGDPDFLNGPGHVLPIVEAMHNEFPDLTYDVTIKIEHLLKYRAHLPRLRQTGCLFVTSAVESFDERILRIFDKHHTHADFVEAARLLRQHQLHLNPTFVAFTPWTTLDGFREMLRIIAAEGLVENVAPVQLAIRLLIPEGSRLLELDETRSAISGFSPEQLSYQWQNPDSAVEALNTGMMEIVNRGTSESQSRSEIFAAAWEALNRISGKCDALPVLKKRAAIPYLNEPWYC